MIDTLYIFFFLRFYVRRSWTENGKQEKYVQYDWRIGNYLVVLWMIRWKLLAIHAEEKICAINVADNDSSTRRAAFHFERGFFICLQLQNTEVQSTYTYKAAAANCKCSKVEQNYREEGMKLEADFEVQSSCNLTINQDIYVRAWRWQTR